MEQPFLAFDLSACDSLVERNSGGSITSSSASS
jgi:hypothetical protein